MGCLGLGWGRRERGICHLVVGVAVAGWLRTICGSFVSLVRTHLRMFASLCVPVCVFRAGARTHARGLSALVLFWHLWFVRLYLQFLCPLTRLPRSQHNPFQVAEPVSCVCFLFSPSLALLPFINHQLCRPLIGWLDPPSSQPPPSGVCMCCCKAAAHTGSGRQHPPACSSSRYPQLDLDSMQFVCRAVCVLMLQLWLQCHCTIQLTVILDSCDDITTSCSVTPAVTQPENVKMRLAPTACLQAHNVPRQLIATCLSAACQAGSLRKTAVDQLTHPCMYRTTPNKSRM